MIRRLSDQDTDSNVVEYEEQSKITSHLGLRPGNESIIKCEMSSSASATSLVCIAIESLKITVCYIMKIYLDMYI